MGKISLELGVKDGVTDDGSGDDNRRMMDHYWRLFIAAVWAVSCIFHVSRVFRKIVPPNYSPTFSGHSFFSAVYPIDSLFPLNWKMVANGSAVQCLVTLHPL